MKHVMILILSAIFGTVAAQPYINKIIPTSFGNVTNTSFVLFNDKYVIPGIYGNNESSLITISKSVDEIQYRLFDSLSFSKDALSIINDTLFAYAKNRFLPNNLQVVSFDADFKLNNIALIPTNGSFDFPTSSIHIDNNIFCSFRFDNNPNDQYKIGISKVDIHDHLLWTKSLDNNIEYAYLWDHSLSQLSGILSSYTILYTNETETYARVIKNDTSGNELWKSDLLPGIFNGSAPVWITELSDSTIFLTFKKNMFFDPEYLNYHPYPPTYIRLDKEGKLTREDILKINPNYEVYISEIKAGKGGYFYVFGQLTRFREDTSNDYYGFITKYANNGDTIWTHTYRHPDYNTYGYFHNVRDLIEEDNGDLTVLGAITPIGGKTEVWLFRVNSKGCFGTDSCDEFTLSGRPVTGSTGEQVTVSPNPTTGRISIQGLPEHAAVTIQLRDMSGRPVLQYAGPVSAIPDISRHPAGMYVLQLGSGGYCRAFKIIKI